MIDALRAKLLAIFKW